MAVQSMRIADAASGNRVQAIDAVELDVDGHATVMERVVSGSAKLPASMGVATRGSGGIITSADTLDLTSLPADLTSHLITVGDGTLLIVAADITISNGYVVVTPIVYDSQESPSIVSILESKTLSCAYAFRRGTGSGNYVCSLGYWDTKGAAKVGLHVTYLYAGTQCYLWGFII